MRFINVLTIATFSSAAFAVSGIGPVHADSQSLLTLTNS